MNITITRKITIIMLFIGITFLGLFSYNQLNVELLPNVEMPVLYVQINSNTPINPSYFETDAVIPIEGAISTIEGVDEMETSISSRRTSIKVSFKKNINFKLISLKLEEKIKESSAALPDNYNVKVARANTDLSNNNFMSLNVSGSGGADRVRNIIDEYILKELENIDGIADVKVYGGRQKAVEVQLNMEACSALGLTPSKISSKIRQNSQGAVFVGSVKDINQKLFVHVKSSFAKVNDIGNVVVSKGPVYLKDVAKISYDVKDKTSYSRIDGKDALTITLKNDAESNVIDLSTRVGKKIDKLNERLVSLDVNISEAKNTAKVMKDNVNQIINLALIGGLLAILILWFFIKNIRLVFFISLAIPISVLAAFNVFYAYCISINTLSLMGIALAIGMLLDNSVVVLENIYRLFSLGKSARDSVLQGTKEVRRSILASTLTTITVFLPFLFSDNPLLKMLGKNVGISIIATLIISLFVALFFIPMVCYLILKSKNNKSGFQDKKSIFSAQSQFFLVGVKTSLRYSWLVIFVAILLFVVSSFLAVTNTGTEKENDNIEMYNISVDMLASSNLETTDKLAKTIEKFCDVKYIKERKKLSTLVQEKNALIKVQIDKDKIKDENRTDDIYYYLLKSIRNIKGSFSLINLQSTSAVSSSDVMGKMANFARMLGVGENRERIVVSGSDFEMLQLVGQDLAFKLKDIEYMRQAYATSLPSENEMIVNFSPELVNLYNISNGDINQSLRKMGTQTYSGSQYKDGDKTYDIILTDEKKKEEEKLYDKHIPTVEELMKRKINSSSTGLKLQVQDIAYLSKQRGFSKIKRKNQQKEVYVYYSFDKSVKKSKSLLKIYRGLVDDLVADYELPSGIAVNVIHEEDNLSDFKFLLIAAFILIFMILASVFESITIPIVLIFCIPLAATGSLLGLYFSGSQLLNANTLTGLLILLGVVVNNGIIMLDYAKILEHKGYGQKRSLMMSGLSRIRPILITTVTTIVALLPIALGKGEYAGVIGAPFAITVIGGLIFSVFLTLFILPAVYTAMSSFLSWYRNELNIKVKLLHFMIALMGVGLIFISEPDLLPRILYTLLLVVLIPGVTYFITHTLRVADKNIIPEKNDLVIKISNLVKIYGRSSRFKREVQGAKAIEKEWGNAPKFHSAKDFFSIIWLLIIFVFIFYFTYFYLENKIWILLFSLFLYTVVNYLFIKLFCYISYKATNKKKIKKIKHILYWFIPASVIIGFTIKLQNNIYTVLVAMIWVFLLLVRKTASKISNNQISIKQIEGRFKKIKRVWYIVTMSVPYFGKHKEPFKALKGVSLEIHTGMFGLLGPNGAGKSTMMRIITGILESSYGSIFINGINTKTKREELQSMIGFLPQEFGMYETMTSWDFLNYQALLRDLKDVNLRNERIEYVLKATHMWENKDDNICSFSGGMKQRIGIAMILLHLPRILVVDEPTAGLDPRERIRFRNLLVELSESRIVIFSTHIIEDIASSCNQVAIISKGSLQYFGKPIDMITHAKGKVWSFLIRKEELENSIDITKVVNHIPEGNLIRVRYIADRFPYEGAVQVEENLEDAYLCMQKSI